MSEHLCDASMTFELKDPSRSLYMDWNAGLVNFALPCTWKRAEE